jgi:type 1 glutamine amidotransferase
MKKIVALVGDYYHDEALARGALTAAHAAAGLAGEAELAFIGADALAEALAQAPAAVVLFKENRLNPQDADVRTWMDESAAERIAQYVRGGGAWLAWHSGLASYPETSAYVRMLRGRFLHHPREHQTVRYAPAAGPGREEEPGGAFAFLDEHYFVECDEANTDVFLRSSSVDGESIAGWRHGHGQGKVCCLTPAHRREGLTDPAFLRVLGQCLRWCLA